jgi:WD40 repeat protein
MAHEAAINHLAFTHAEGSSSSSSSSLVVVSGSADWTVRTWDVHANAVGGTCVGLGGAVTSLTLVNAPSARTSSSSSSSKAVLAGAADGSIGMWRLGGELVWLEQGHAAAVLAVAAGSHPASLVTGEPQQTLYVWYMDMQTVSHHLYSYVVIGMPLIMAYWQCVHVPD